MNPATSRATSTPEPAHFTKYFINRKVGFTRVWSEWSAVTTESDGCGDKDHRECQPDPQTERGHVSCWCECDGIDRVPMEGKRFRGEAHHARLQHGGKM